VGEEGGEGGKGYSVGRSVREGHDYDRGCGEGCGLGLEEGKKKRKRGRGEGFTDDGEGGGRGTSLLMTTPGECPSSLDRGGEKGRGGDEMDPHGGGDGRWLTFGALGKGSAAFVRWRKREEGERCGIYFP